MAFSKSVAKAQDILQCQLCETDPNIKWKCVDCQLLMCIKCRDRIHPKFKNAEDHEIINLKEVRPRDDRHDRGGQKLDFTKIRCEQHQSQVCCLFCTSCDKLVCPSCVSKSHTGHKFTEINEAYDLKTKHLEKSKRKLDNDINNFTKGLQELNKLKTSEDSKCKEVIRQIQDQRAVLKQEVDRNADNLIKEVDKKLGKIQDSISGEKMKVEKTIKHLEDRSKMAESIITTTDVSKFFDEVEQICQVLKQVIPPVNLAHNSIPKFVPGEKSCTTVGLLQETNDRSDTKIQMTVSKEISSTMKYIHDVSICKDNSLWLGDSFSEVIQRVKLKENSLKQISNVSSKLRGMVVTPSGDLLFGNRQSSLKILTYRNEKITDFVYNVAPLLIKSVHITHNNKVIVGAHSNCGEKPLFPASGRRVVIVMDDIGSQEAVYEYDNKNKQLFTYPNDISSTRTGSIGVVDKLSSNNRGRVVVLLDGNITGIYTGHPEINKDKPFTPTKIVATPSDNFIVKDLNASNLHILDSLGHIITYYNPGIKDSYVMSFSTSGQLYIGTSPPTNSSYNAKLCILDISGF